jgi:hypothetical protein
MTKNNFELLENGLTLFDLNLTFLTFLIQKDEVKYLSWRIEYQASSIELLVRSDQTVKTGVSFHRKCLFKSENDIFKCENDTFECENDTLFILSSVRIKSHSKVSKECRFDT